MKTFAPIYLILAFLTFCEFQPVSAQQVKSDTIYFDSGFAIKQTSIDQNDRVVSVQTFVMGKNEGPVEFYVYKDGKTLMKTGYIQNGVRIGIWEVFNRKRKKWILIGRQVFNFEGREISSVGFDIKGRKVSEKKCNALGVNCLYKHYNLKGELEYVGTTERALLLQSE